MTNLGVIQIVASCVRAFNNGADRLELLQARAARDDHEQRLLSEREKALADMLQKLLKEGGDSVANRFQEAQKQLGRFARLLHEGDDTAKIELLGIALQLQEEIADKLSAAAINGDAKGAVDGLQALYKSAMVKQMDAEQSIAHLQQRIQRSVQDDERSDPALGRRISANSMARDFRSDAISFSRDNPQAGPSNQRQGLSVEQQLLIPDIRADDIQSLAITDWDQDDRFTMAPELPRESDAQQRAVSPLEQVRRLDYSSAASYRAAFAPEPIEKQFKPARRIEEAGPYFDPTDRVQSHEDREIPVLASKSRDSPTMPRPSRARSSLPEPSQRARTDSLPWTQRMLSPASVKSRTSSMGISEPDSAISLKNDFNKAYCTGALSAQEDFILGFARDFLPTLPGSSKRELCWKCKYCDLNFCDNEGQLLEGIYFEEGVRYRFGFLARSHVAYEHPEQALRPAYQYACQFCTAEGKRTSKYLSTEKLMSHIHSKHRTHLTPEVKSRVRCIVGRSAGREEQWDCNLPDVGSQGGMLKKFMITSLTGLRS